jgi:hypothetical protein
MALIISEIKGSFEQGCEASPEMSVIDVTAQH